MNNQENKDKTDQAKNKVPEKANNLVISERERHKGKINKAENKVQATIIKARSKNQGHEAVLDQKSHEYH